MNISNLKENENIKDILIQMSDEISELDRLIENINILSEEVYTLLVNQTDSKTEANMFAVSREMEVSGIKAGMIREFIIKAGKKINGLINLSDKSIELVNSKNT